MEPLFISRPDAANCLNISTDTLDVLVAKGYINRLKIGAKTCFAPDELRRFAAYLKEKGAISIA